MLTSVTLHKTNYRNSLIWQKRQQICASVLQNSVTMINTPTGSGKSTTLPLCIKSVAGFGVRSNGFSPIVIVVSSCLVAYTLATYMSCGYRTRNNGSKYCMETDSFIYFTTDIIMEEILRNPLLPDFEILILDDYQTKGKDQDIILSIIKNIMQIRLKFKLVITSSVFDVENLSLFFMSSRISTSVINLENFCEKDLVEEFFLKNPCQNYVTTALETVVNIHLKESSFGSILVFLPTRFDIILSAEKLKHWNDFVKDSDT